MTIQDLINDINALYPNTFTDVQKISWLNSVKIPKDILKQICKKEILNFPTVIDKAIYEETLSIDFQLIEKITVNGQELKPAPSDDTDETFNGGYWYTKFLDDYLFINPTPTEDNLDIQVEYYINRPKYSTVADTIDLKDDYIELLKIGVLIFMAKVNVAQGNADEGIINNYVDDFNDLIGQIKSDENVSNDTSNTIENVMGW